MAKTKPSDAAFDSAAELFAVLANPIRLHIINALRDGEKNVSQLLEEVGTTQPNMSQHLSTLFGGGLLARRREGTQIYYRIQSERAAVLCRAVIGQMTAELEPSARIPEAQRLRPAPARGASSGRAT